VGSVPGKVIDDELAGEVLYVKIVYPCLWEAVSHRNSSGGTSLFSKRNQIFIP